MGGHSNWSQVKRQKGVSDAKRGQLFTKLSREITVAAREGGGPPPRPPPPRLAIDKARESNMPADTIKRAIERGVGGGEGARALQEIVFEGYGPGGVASLHSTPPAGLDQVRRQLQEAGLAVAAAELSLLPRNTLDLDERAAAQALKLLD